MKENEADIFAEKLKLRFDRSADTLDRDILSRIRRIRNRAVDQAPISPRPRFWMPAGAIATAALALLVYSILPQHPVNDKLPVDEIEIISELDLYENIEFYEWLEQYELPV